MIAGRLARNHANEQAGHGYLRTLIQLHIPASGRTLQEQIFLTRTRTLEKCAVVL